jgi:predicted rRNA methylase YqxC with S4 and FtsJ domains
VKTSGATSVVTRQSLVDRLVQAGISEARAKNHVRRGAVLVDGRVVTDPASEASLPARVEIRFVRRADKEG